MLYSYLMPAVTMVFVSMMGFYVDPAGAHLSSSLAAPLFIARCSSSSLAAPLPRFLLLFFLACPASSLLAISHFHTPFLHRTTSYTVHSSSSPQL